jgi:UPF0271 protein
VAGFDPFSIAEEQYTVPLVKNEILTKRISGLRFEVSVESGRLKVRMPRKTFLDKAEAQATLIGDKSSLSPTDLQLLGLALELKTSGYSPLIVTDDYAIQNVANQMGIEFASLITFGIRRRWEWIRYCPACHKNYPPDNKTKRCVICGTELKRKPLRKSRLANGSSPKT